MSNRLYDLDPKLKELLQESSFRGKFDVNEFIQALSERELANQKQQEVSHGFEPKPLIRDFELAFEKLNTLKTQISKDIEKEEKAVKAAEMLHHEKVRLLNQKFETVIRSFESLEGKISSIGTTTIQVGKSLDVLSKQLTKAQYSSKLVSTYLSLKEKDRNALNRIERNKGKMSIEEAKFIRSLLQVCRDVDLEGSKDTTEVVERSGEQIENDVLEDFEAAYQVNDLQNMARCAFILTEFNGGASVHRSFVNSHDFFLKIQHMESDEKLGGDELWEMLPNPDVDPPGLEPSLVKLFREIKKTVREEFLIINRVFPVPVTVKCIFLQRIFAQTVQARLEEVMTFAENTSTLSFLRSLQATHEILGALLTSIKSQKSISSEEAQQLSSVLDSNMEDLFVPYLEANRYIEKEKKCLGELYSSVLYKFSRFHSAKRNNKSTTMFDRFVSSNSKEDGKVGSLLRLAGVDRKKSQSDGLEVEAEIAAEDGLLSVSNVKRMLKWHAEACGRAVELADGKDTSRDAMALMNVLLDYVSRNYIEVWLDNTLDDLSTADKGRSEPDLGYFVMIREATSISRLLLSYVDTVLLPLSGRNLTIRREVIQKSHHNVVRIDGKINALIQRSIDSILSWMTTILARQLKRDYQIGETELNLSNLQTTTNAQAVAFLATAGKIAQANLTGSNLEAYLTEVGIRVNYMLLDHYKKFSVSSAGGLLLTKDISRYQELVASWNLASLNPRYVLLREIGNVFVVTPEILRNNVKEGELSHVNRQHLVPYLQCRSDYYAESLNKVVLDGVAPKYIPAMLQNPFSETGYVTR